MKARVTVDHAPVAIALPLGALQTVAANDVVYVRDGDVYSMRAVKLGRRDAQRVEVVTGLQAGDKVILTGKIPLTDGQPVTEAAPKP